VRQGRREHPGQLIRRHILDRHALSISEAAHLLGVPTRTLLDLLAGKAALSPEMAERIEVVFGEVHRTSRRNRKARTGDGSETAIRGDRRVG
jgi:plasmid maintenance system antidote protein VapI